SSIESSRIEIIEEYDEPQGNDDKIYLTESETGVLKYINGENSVLNLVEMGLFNKYKVYKSIYNLKKKGIIQPKETDTELEIERELLISSESSNHAKINITLISSLVLLIIIFFASIFKPNKPFNSENIIYNKTIIEKFINKTK
ncbi:MAG: hypothetical protein ABFR75_11775, partial [Acidobacteriota bacterium]